MKFSKIKFGILLIIIGLALTAFFYSSNDFVDTLCGALVGGGIGLTIWGFFERNKVSQTNN